MLQYNYNNTILHNKHKVSTIITKQSNIDKIDCSSNMTANLNKGKGRVEYIDKLIGNNVKMKRLSLGLSQQEVARAINVSTQQMQKYETGINRISGGKLFNLANFLGVSITYFFRQLRSCSNVLLDEVISFSDKEALTLLDMFSAIRDVKIKKHIITIIGYIAKYGQV